MVSGFRAFRVQSVQAERYLMPIAVWSGGLARLSGYVKEKQVQRILFSLCATYLYLPASLFSMGVGALPTCMVGWHVFEALP